MAFQNLNLRFDTPRAFALWLAQQPHPRWGVLGSTYHNTYRPDEAQWRGHASMASMQGFYAAKGWDRGPHLYLASGTAHDGIFVMTPPWLEGIHGMSCNSHYFGVETVADWDARPPTDAQTALLVETLAVLHDYAQLGPVLNAHRDCAARTCPGQYGYAIKDALTVRLTAALASIRVAPDLCPSTGYTTESSLVASVPDAHDAYVAALQRRCPAIHYDVSDIHLIASQYWLQSTALGLDPWLVAAQLCHETGNLTSWWCQRPRRNPAGLGVTGRTTPTRPPDATWAYDDADRVWRYGLSFPAWVTDSIPAHVGRLLAYATTPAQRAPAQQQAVTTALSYRSLPASVHGSAPTLQHLGQAHNPSGLGWASPGTDYGARLATIANALKGGM